jgi:hypothetical protein
MGVTKGFAIKKFSGSAKRLGKNRIIVINKDRAIKYPRASLTE